MSSTPQPATVSPVAVCYARFSSELQRDASIVDQHRACSAEIGRQGWQAGPAYADHAVSGSTALRRGYQDLLDGVVRRSFHIIVAEALDRPSRDQEDLAALYKRCTFAGIRIFTLAEGWINELHVGLKGTMSALFLKDLADTTRRGLRGRVTAGASAGGFSYGYAVDLAPAGEDRGPWPAWSPMDRHQHPWAGRPGDGGAQHRTLHRPARLKPVFLRPRPEHRQTVGMPQPEGRVGRVERRQHAHCRRRAMAMCQAQQGEVRSAMARDGTGAALNRAHRAQHPPVWADRVGRLRIVLRHA